MKASLEITNGSAVKNPVKLIRRHLTALLTCRMQNNTQMLQLGGPSLANFLRRSETNGRLALARQFRVISLKERKVVNLKQQHPRKVAKIKLQKHKLRSQHKLQLKKAKTRVEISLVFSI